MLGDRQRLGEERDALGFAGDAEAGFQTRPSRCSVRIARPSAWKVWMETALPLLRQQADKTLAHLRGGAAGEGDGEAALRRHAALGDEMRDAVGQRARLAGTRARRR